MPRDQFELPTSGLTTAYRTLIDPIHPCLSSGLTGALIPVTLQAWATPTAGLAYCLAATAVCAVVASVHALAWRHDGRIPTDLLMGRLSLLSLFTTASITTCVLGCLNGDTGLILSGLIAMPCLGMADRTEKKRQRAFKKMRGMRAPK